MVQGDWESPFIARLRGAVAGRRVIPPAPDGCVARVAERDDDASMRAVACELVDQRGRVSGLGLYIEYSDADGVVTERRVSCRRLEAADAFYLFAWCHERGAPRRFRVDRILQAIDVTTGECYPVASLFARLAEHGLPVVDVRLQKLLIILTFLMRCDGVAHPAEQEVLERAVAGYVLRFGGDDAAYDAAMRLAASLAPDERDFMQAMKVAACQGDAGYLARFILPYMAMMVDADDRHSPEEVYHATEASAYLRRAAGVA